MSAPTGYHWSHEKPHMVSEGKYSSPIFRDSVSSREVYYAPLYFIVSPTAWICCIEKCPLKQSPIKMYQTKANATVFQNFLSHLNIYHPYCLRASDRTSVREEKVVKLDNGQQRIQFGTQAAERAHKKVKRTENERITLAFARVSAHGAYPIRLLNACPIRYELHIFYISVITSIIFLHVSQRYAYRARYRGG